MPKKTNPNAPFILSGATFEALENLAAQEKELAAAFKAVKQYEDNKSAAVAAIRQEYQAWLAYTGKLPEEVDPKASYTDLMQKLPIRDTDGNLLADLTINFGSVSRAWDTKALEGAAAVNPGLWGLSEIKQASHRVTIKVK